MILTRPSPSCGTDVPRHSPAAVTPVLCYHWCHFSMLSRPWPGRSGVTVWLSKVYRSEYLWCTFTLKYPTLTSCPHPRQEDTPLARHSMHGHLAAASVCFPVLLCVALVFVQQLSLFFSWLELEDYHRSPHPSPMTSVPSGLPLPRTHPGLVRSGVGCGGPGAAHVQSFLCVSCLLHTVNVYGSVCFHLSSFFIDK